jgi:hypothetical protein
MTYTDTGTQGAKRQSWREANPRAGLKDLIDKNPDASEDEVLQLQWDTVTRGVAFKKPENESMFRTIFEYWFTNNYRSLVTERAPRKPRAASQPAVQGQAAEQHVDRLRQSLTKKVEEKAQLLLLDLIMPNGKSLRENTKEDCANTSGWMAKLAARLKPGQTVGAALSEKQVRAICQRGCK